MIEIKNLTFPKGGGLDLEWDEFFDIPSDENPEVMQTRRETGKRDSNSYIMTSEFGDELRVLAKLTAGLMQWTSADAKDRVTVTGLKSISLADEEKQTVVICFTKTTIDGKTVGMNTGIIDLNNTKFTQQAELKSTVEAVINFAIAHHWRGEVANPDLWKDVQEAKKKDGVAFAGLMRVAS